MGETQEERILQFLEENDAPVVGLREGGWIRIEGSTATLGGSPPARVFARGRAPLEVLILGGRPLREPVARYGPFVMNTEGEIRQAILDYQDGRMGEIATAR